MDDDDVDVSDNCYFILIPRFFFEMKMTLNPFKCLINR